MAAFAKQRSNFDFNFDFAVGSLIIATVLRVADRELPESCPSPPLETTVGHGWQIAPHDILFAPPSSSSAYHFFLACFFACFFARAFRFLSGRVARLWRTCCTP